MNLDRINWQIVIPKQNQLALTLIKELNEELLSRYPSSSVHELDLDKIDNKNGIFNFRGDRTKSDRLRCSI
ncbi:MAG: hypothetical protein QNJ38_17145 [Prochloraceae cyanobacterium]|nr:hypothetical protein [Prochloraceae cyanobacterium]